MDKASRFILENKRCCLFLRTGYGKTRLTIEGIELLRVLGDINRILIVAPKMVALDTWPEELKRYNITPNMIMGDRTQRTRALLRTYPPYNVINIENLPWLIEKMDKPFKALNDSGDGFDTIIIDESSKFKSPTSQRFHTVKDVIDQAERVILLSGTPISNGITDIWAQMRIVDRGRRLGRSYYAFRRRYFFPVGKFKWEPFNGSEQRITDLISDICYSQHDPAIKQVPEKKIVHPVILDAKSERIYKEIKQNFIYEWESGDTLTVANAGVAIGKLLQICGGSVYLPEKYDHKPVIPVNTVKLNRLRKLIYDLNKPMIIVYNYKFELAGLQAMLPANITSTISKEAIQRWNSGQLRYLLIHPLSAGHGLNLQFGGNTIVWFGLTWSLENYMQTNARVTRRGQKEGHTEIHHIVTKRTVEDSIMRRLHYKKNTQQNFIMGLIDDILLDK